jgi:ubiquinone/menaquinone biosynthesis C-methylase UbiE
MNFDEPAQAETYDRWYASPLGDWVDRCEKEAVIALLPPLTGLRILDAGCGTGNFSLTLAARGADMVGVDRSAAMLFRARGKRREGPGRVEWVLGDLAQLPFPAHSFDGVLSILALDFSTSREAVIRELGRVLKPGGFLVAAVLNRYSLWTLKRKLWARVSRQAWRGVDFLRQSDLAGLLPSTIFSQFRWRRAVYCLPSKFPPLLRLAPCLERLGPRLAPGAAAFLAVSARKKCGKPGADSEAGSSAPTGR